MAKRADEQSFMSCKKEGSSGGEADSLSVDRGAGVQQHLRYPPDNPALVISHSCLHSFVYLRDLYHSVSVSWSCAGILRAQKQEINTLCPQGVHHFCVEKGNTKKIPV